jgi:hypothetical protein
MTSRRLLSPSSVTLLKAANYMEEHGWCQHREIDDHGRVCAYGAILKVAEDEDWGGKAAGRLRSYIGCGGIATWNDQPGRTEAEVIATMRAAAIF